MDDAFGCAFVGLTAAVEGLARRQGATAGAGLAQIIWARSGRAWLREF
jgi:hypothetical protein